MLEFELVLPCYNEEKSLNALIHNTINAAKKFDYTPEQFQLLLVENGSKDNSFTVMNELKNTPEGIWFKIVPIPTNKGYGYGVFEGLKTTTAPFIGWMHADLQCDPMNAFEALNILKNSAQKELTLVKGIRKGRNWKDIFVSRVFEFMAFLFLGFYTNEINAQPKIFHRNLLNQIQNPPMTFAFDVYVMYQAHKLKFEFKTISVLFPPRMHGVSNWASTFLGKYKTIFSIIRYMCKLARSEGRL